MAKYLRMMMYAQLSQITFDYRRVQYIFKRIGGASRKPIMFNHVPLAAIHCYWRMFQWIETY